MSSKMSGLVIMSEEVTVDVKPSNPHDDQSSLQQS